jgi:hypothetical protein
MSVMRLFTPLRTISATTLGGAIGAGFVLGFFLVWGRGSAAGPAALLGSAGLNVGSSAS